MGLELQEEPRSREQGVCTVSRQLFRPGGRSVLFLCTLGRLAEWSPAAGDTAGEGRAGPPNPLVPCQSACSLQVEVRAPPSRRPGRTEGAREEMR